MRTFTFTLNEQQISIVNAALIELPHKHVAGIIEHLNAEIKKNLDDELVPVGPTPIKPKRAPSKPRQA